MHRGKQSIYFMMHIDTEATLERGNIQIPRNTLTRFRWYNTTYALYASMIILYLILLNYTVLPAKVLLEDVEKSLEIFIAMDNINVARRCAELIREVLDVTKKYLHDRLDSEQISLERLAQRTEIGRGHDVTHGAAESHNAEPFRTDTGSSSDPNHNDDVMKALFGFDWTGRGDLLAGLIDPVLLEDFTARNTSYGVSPDSSVAYGHTGIDLDHTFRQGGTSEDYHGLQTPSMVTELDPFHNQDLHRGLLNSHDAHFTPNDNNSNNFGWSQTTYRFGLSNEYNMG
jgi:hypothetical protein